MVVRGRVGRVVFVDGYVIVVIGKLRRRTSHAFQRFVGVSQRTGGLRMMSATKR